MPPSRRGFVLVVLLITLTACSSHHSPATASDPTASPAATAATPDPPAASTSAWPPNDPGTSAPPLYHFAAVSGAPSAGAFAAGLRTRWHLMASKAHPVEGMAETVYRAGAATPQQGRTITATVYAHGTTLLYVTCAGGGQGIAERSDQALHDFIYDCGQRALAPADRLAIKSWLDAHYYAVGVPEAKLAATHFHADLLADPQWVRLEVTGPSGS